MPYRFVPSPVFMTHNGVNIYHVFKNDDEESCTRTFWYSVNPYAMEGGEGEFDVRDLPAWDKRDEAKFPPGPPLEYIENVIAAAIDSGDITVPEHVNNDIEPILEGQAIDVLIRLLQWEKTMGGWDSLVWRQAHDVVDQARMVLGDAFPSNADLNVAVLRNIDRELLEQQRKTLWHFVSTHSVKGTLDPETLESLEGLISMTDVIADQLDQHPQPTTEKTHE